MNGHQSQRSGIKIPVMSCIYFEFLASTAPPYPTQLYWVQLLYSVRGRSTGEKEDWTIPRIVASPANHIIIMSRLPDIKSAVASWAMLRNCSRVSPSPAFPHYSSLRFSPLSFSSTISFSYVLPVLLLFSSSPSLSSSSLSPPPPPSPSCTFTLHRKTIEIHRGF